MVGLLWDGVVELVVAEQRSEHTIEEVFPVLSQTSGQFVGRKRPVAAEFDRQLGQVWLADPLAKGLDPRSEFRRQVGGRGRGVARQG